MLKHICLPRFAVCKSLFNILFRCIIVGILGGSIPSLKAQLTVNNAVTVDQIVAEIVGPGFKVVSSSLNCPPNAIGLFDGSGTNVGINNGVIITNGDVNLAIGPNNQVDAGFNNGTPGTNSLDILSGTTTFDACVLEIDLIPLCDTLRIQYVFGSEEYPEYISRGFNDVFAFYVSGPGIVGEQNIALVPGTNVPVAVNTINGLTNAGYYKDNTGGTTIQYDAFTTLLEGKIGVQTCETYHLKLAISDVTDGIFESGVFIQGNSVACANVQSNSITATSIDARENCLNGEITFCRSGDLTSTMSLPIQIDGVAQNGLDYALIPDSVVFPASTACATIPVIPINDNITELKENIRIVYQSEICPTFDTVNVSVHDAITVDAGPDLQFCSGQSALMGKDSVINYQYSWTPTTGLSDPNVLHPTVSLTNTTTSSLTMNYVLTATDGTCNAFDSVRITVDPIPVADFRAENGCLGSELSFTDNSLNVSSWLWDFGDGYLDTLPNPKHIYQTTGKHTLKLSLTNGAGCSSIDSTEIEIWSLPVANFAASDACYGSLINFINTSLPGSDGNISSYEWNYGDLSPIDNRNNPQYSYKNFGVFNVALKIGSDSGCVDSVVKRVEIYPTPKINIAVDTTCFFFESKILNNTTISNGSISGWFWDFGDGNTFVGQHPTHTFGAPGTYDIKLMATSGLGCLDSSMAQITILPPPTANFLVNDVCLNESTNFTDQSTSTGVTINKWTWILDSTYIKSSQHTSFNFSDYGTHDITLIIETDYGCKDTASQTVEVFSNPNADFSVAEICEKDTASFVDLSTLINPLDLITNYLWDFGDGSRPETTQNPKHFYMRGGNYNIRLIVSTQNGCSDTVSKILSVRYNPVADFTSKVSCINSLSQFNDASTVTDGFIQQWDWQFSGGASYGIINPIHEFITTGNHDIKLLVTTNYGCTDSITKSVNLNAKPTAVILPIDDHCFGDAQDFIDASISNGDPIKDWYWEFGNGFFNKVQKANYTYLDTGVYTVTLIVTNSSGCSDTATEEVTVLPLPEVDFLVTNACIGDSSMFVSQAASLNPKRGIVSSVWSFGDGSAPKTGDSLMHLYSASGTYNASLVVVSNSGCVNTMSKKVLIYELPIVDFRFASECLGQPIRFFNQSIVPTGSFSRSTEWDFGDGIIDSLSSPMHIYLNDNTYDVKLKVTSNFGCTDSIIKQVEVFPLPEVSITVDTSEGCAPLTALFKIDVVSSNGVSLDAFLWDFGDGKESTEKEPTYVFTENGNFMVSLTVTDARGCKATASDSNLILVYPQPEPGFVYTPYEVYTDDPTITIRDQSSGSIFTEWNFGDGTITSQQSPQHTYKSAGTYLITQSLTNQFNCKASMSKSVLVGERENIYIPNVFTPNIKDGKNDVFMPVVTGPLADRRYEMRIFDRWGLTVFFSDDLNTGWDGRYKGKDGFVPLDVYVYQIKFFNRITGERIVRFTGKVTILK